MRGRSTGALGVLLLALNAAAFFATSEAPIDSSVLAGPGVSLQTEPVVAAHDGGFLAAWTDLRRSDQSGDINTARLDPSGTPLGLRSLVAVGGGGGLDLVAWLRPGGANADVLAARVATGAVHLRQAAVGGFPWLLALGAPLALAGRRRSGCRARPCS
ncbi:MAG: hypothetical protein ACYC8T_07430 [Myxococcaceae bacterium]